MPNVPQVPGVPALASYAGDAVILLAADAVSSLLGTLNPWGIFFEGFRVMEADSFSAVGVRKESTVADYPIEAPGDGQSSGFMSYDKVAIPRECRVRLTVGGSEGDRAALIAEVEEAEESLDLFDIVTPERFYEGYNVSRYTYDRSAMDGAGLVKIDITFTQIRSSEVSSFSNTQQPGSAGQQGLGNVQPTRINGPGNITAFPLGSVQ